MRYGNDRWIRNSIARLGLDTANWDETSNFFKNYLIGAAGTRTHESPFRSPELYPLGQAALGERTAVIWVLNFQLALHKSTF